MFIEAGSTLGLFRRRLGPPVLAALLVTLGVASGPRTSALGRRAEFRFHEGTATGGDLNGFFWLVTSGARSWGSFGDERRDIGFRTEGSVHRGRLDQKAIYPPDGRRLGEFHGSRHGNSWSGKWSAVGRRGGWSAATVPEDPAAMAALSGIYLDPSPPQGVESLRVLVSAAEREVRIEVQRGGRTLFLAGPWIADSRGRAWFLPLRGNGTLRDLVPFGVNLKGFPIQFPYRLFRSGRLRLFSPLDREERIGTLLRAV